MPSRFYKYLISDVLKQFAITASILVVVIAFGAAIKPLSNDQLLSGWDTIKYLAFALVPMLQFAIPFAAAFAVTMSLHRMSQDNEIVAIALSGQSYVRLLAPVIAFGIVLSLTLVLLTQLIIPYFVGMMASAMSADLPRLLVRSIKQNSPFVQDDLVIWAENIYLNDEEGDESMVLDHIAVAKRDEMGRPDMYLTASAARIDVERADAQTSFYVMARDASQWTRGENGAGVLRGAQQSTLTHGIDLPSITQQRPSSLSFFELLNLKSNPRNYPPVNRAMNRLEASIAKADFIESLHVEFNKSNELIFKSITGGREFHLKAAGFKNKDLFFQGPIEVASIRTTGELSLLLPKTAKLILEQDSSGFINSITLQMKNVRVGSEEANPNIRSELIVPNLVARGFSQERIQQSSTNVLLDKADRFQSKSVLVSSNALKKTLNDMQHQVLGRVNQRFALSILPFLIVILGGLLAIRFSRFSALVVYARVFGPAIVALLLVFSGGQMVRDSRIAEGFIIMWSGHIFLTAIIAMHWLKLRKI